MCLQFENEYLRLSILKLYLSIYVHTKSFSSNILIFFMTEYVHSKMYKTIHMQCPCTTECTLLTPFMYNPSRTGYQQYFGYN